MRGVHDPRAPALPPRRYPAPLSCQRARAAIEMLRPPAGGRLLDLAAGTRGLPLEATARYDGRDVELVAAEANASAARAAAVNEGLANRAEFVVAKAAQFGTERRFDAVRSLAWLGAGGVLRVGVPCFCRPPSPAYRAPLS